MQTWVRTIQAKKAIGHTGTELRTLKVLARNIPVVLLNRVRVCQGVWRTLCLQP